jgi:hypothetical protein
MALMASKSSAFVDPNSRLELKTCVEYLWLPTFIVWVVNIVFLVIHHRFSQFGIKKTSLEDVSSEITASDQAHDQEQPSLFFTENSAKLPRFTERFRLRRLGNTREETLPMQLRTLPLMIDRSVSVASFSSLDENINDKDNSFQPSESRLFKIILVILLITVIALLFASNDKVSFDIGMLFDTMSMLSKHFYKNRTFQS